MVIKYTVTKISERKFEVKFENELFIDWTGKSLKGVKDFIEFLEKENWPNKFRKVDKF